MKISDQTVKDSFFLSYIFLFGLTLITFIEAIGTKDVKIRHIMNLETAVSLVAGYVYSILLDRINSKTNPLDLKDVTNIRYMDWIVTTPMLLLVILLFFNYNTNEPIYISVYILIILINYAMLLSGYLGETKQLEKKKACAMGFIFFILLITIIYLNFMKNPSHVESILYIIFVIVWSLYGVAFLLDVNAKNIMYNILDIISKVFFGIFMWIYYGNVFHY